MEGYVVSAVRIDCSSIEGSRDARAAARVAQLRRDVLSNAEVLAPFGISVPCLAFLHMICWGNSDPN